MKRWIVLCAILTSQISIASREFIPIVKRNHLQDEGSAVSDSTFSAYRRFKRDSIDFLPEDSSPAHPHLKRASPDNLKPAVQRVQKVARIINGIYIQQGVITASIPSDELISELLFFGSVTPSGIAKLDSKKMEEAVSIVRDLPTTFASTTDTEKAEKAFGLVKQMKDMLNTSDAKWNMDEFKGDIKRLETDGVATQLLKELRAASVNLDLGYGAVKSNISTQDTVSQLKSGLGQLKKSVSSFDKSQLQWNFNHFETAVDGISPLTKAREATEFYAKNRDNMPISDDKNKPYTDFIRSISAKTMKFKGVESSLQDVGEVVIARKMRSRQRNLRHTHGLSSGSSDVSQMMKDVNDPWIKKVLKTDNVEIAFKQFNEFESLLKSIEQSLDIDGEKASKIYQLMEYGKQAVQITNVEQLNTGLQKMKTCLNSSNSIDLSQFIQFNASLAEIDNKLQQFDAKTEELSLVLSTPDLVKMCGDVIKICDEESDPAAAAKKLTEYENITELNTAIESISTTLTDIQQMNNRLKSDAATVTTQLNAFGPILGPLTKISSEVFDCLNHKDVQYVFKSSKGIKSFRSLKDDSTFVTAGDAGSEAVNKVIGIQKDLKTLDDYVGKMKGFKSEETSALSKLDSVSTHSRVIGSAVEGVANMKNALEQKDTVDHILNNLELVNASKQLLADSQDKKNLDSLIKLEPMIQKMYKSLKEFSGKVTYSDSPVLLDQSSIFKQASSVSGIKGNFSEIGSSVEKLIEKTSDPNDKKKLEDVQSSLIAMDSMGLDFSVYQKSFEDSSVAMEAIDIFFQIPPNELEKVGDTLKIAGGSVVAVIVLFLVAYVVMYIFWRKTLIKIIRLVFCVVWRRRRRHKILLEKYVNVFYGYLCQMHKADYINPNLEEKDFGNMVVKLFKAKLKSDEVVRPETSELAKESPEDRQSNNKSYKAYEVELSREGYGKRFYDGHIFSINYPLPNGKHMVAVQAPIADPPTAPPKAGKLWWMIKQLKSKNVVMLCPHSMEVTVEPVVKVEEVKKTKKKKGPKKESEDEDNPPVEEKPKEKKYLAGDFFPTKVGQEMTTEEIKLKCISKSGKLYDILKIKVEIPGEKPFVVDFHWYQNWVIPDLDKYKFNPDVNALIAILQVIEESQTPTVVISECGVERTGVLAFTEFLLDQLKKRVPFQFEGVLPRLRKYNPECIVSSEEYQMAAYLLLEYLRHGLDLPKELDGKYKVCKEPLSVVFVEKDKLEGENSTTID